MDTDQEFMSLSDAEEPSSPIPERKLRRLRKATDKVSKDPLPNPSSDDVFSNDAVDSSQFEAPDTGEKNGKYLEEPSARFGSQSEGFEEGNESYPSFDGLGVEEGQDGESSAKRVLQFDLPEQFDGKGEDPTEGMGVEEGTGEFRIQESERKRHNLDGFEKKEKKKKKVKSAGEDYDDKPHSAASSKRSEDKARREHLKELRAESQRLLRETRDASFKPVPFVQKPISSVLEKIRQRKLEVSKKSVVVNQTSFIDGNSTFSRELILDFDFENASFEDIEVPKVEKPDIEEKIAHLVETENTLDSPSAGGSKDIANHSHKNALDEEPKQTFLAPVDHSQDLIFDSQTSDSKDELLDDTPSSPLEEVLAPSFLAMNLKLNSAPPDDFSSDEEDNNKENIDPHLHGSVDLSSSPRGDPAKAFVDDEAEEEDDSDHDLHRFQDDEEDEDIMDSQELNDMIATGYEEKSIDHEIRNELHQKWLEQQDAAGTENLLQRLKCGSKQRETTLLEEKEDIEIEQDEEELLDEGAEYPVARNVVRMNLKKAKEMIPHMFTDKDDIYVSSDEEQTENRLMKQRYNHKPEVQATFLSPAEDEGSKDFFGLIKKLNGVPDTRRKAKITSSFHMLSIGGSKTMPSKSSFVGRGTKNSVPSFQKHGSSTFRSFVFERDDSHSTSTISMLEESSDSIQKGNRPRKTAAAKFSSSQITSSAQNTQTAAVTKSGPSLHEILRCPSLQSSNCNQDSMINHVEAIYAAFKLDQNLTKRKTGVSIRTV